MIQFSYKQIRQMQGLTQNELAKICGVDRRTITRFENGKSNNGILKKWYNNTLMSVISEFKGE